MFTLRQIKARKPCREGLDKLVSFLGPNYGDDTPITIDQILESNGLDDGIWAVTYCVTNGPRLVCQLALDCVWQLRRLPTDALAMYALAVAQEYLDGNVSLGAPLQSIIDMEPCSTARGWEHDAAWAAARAVTYLQSGYSTASIYSNASDAAEYAAACSDHPLDALEFQKELLAGYCTLGTRPSLSKLERVKSGLQDLAEGRLVKKGSFVSEATSEIAKANLEEFEREADEAFLDRAKYERGDRDA